MNKNYLKNIFLAVSIFLIASSCASAKGVEKTCKQWSDLNETNTYCKYANYLNVQEVVKGYPDGTFKPSNNITRGEFAKIIQSGFEIPINTDDKEFTDVDTDNTFYLSIQSLKNSGIVNGYSDQTFKPSVYITRGEAAKLVIKAIEYKGLDDKLTTTEKSLFKDIKDGSSFESYINTLAYSSRNLDSDKKILSGFSDGTFRPDEKLTRGQAAKIITNSMKFVEIEKVTCDNYYCDLETSLEQYLYELINKSRENADKENLSRDSKVDSIAKNWSKHMSVKDDFNHNTNLSKNLDSAGIDWQANGENIGYSKMTNLGDDYYWTALESIHKEMMDEVPPDDGHKKNILSDTYTHIGVGIYVDKHDNVNKMWTTEDYYKEQ